MTFEELNASYEYPNSAPEDVVVSVVILTYNHSPYIAQAIESVLMQKTDFPVEICIGEDESNDGLATEEQVELTVLAQSVSPGYKPGNGAQLRLARFLNRRPLDKLISRLFRDSPICRIRDRYVRSGRSVAKFSQVLREERPDAVFIEFGHNAVMLGPSRDSLFARPLYALIKINRVSLVEFT